MEVLFFLLALISEIIGTLVGFGSTTILLPLALLFFDFRTALVLAAFFHLFGNFARANFFKHSLDKRMIVQFGVPSLLFSIVGAILVSSTPQQTLKGLLGLFLCGYAGLTLWKSKFAIKPTFINTLFGGAVSGFIAGLIGTGGGLRAAFFTAFRIPKQTYIATSAVIAVAVDATRIPLYLQQGFLKPQLYRYLPVLFVMAFAGSFLGKQIVDKIPQEIFRKVVLAAVLLIGAKFIFDWITAL